jgi:hypothetical protein
MLKKEFYVYTFDLIFVAEMSFSNTHPMIDPHMHLRTGTQEEICDTVDVENSNTIGSNSTGKI